MKRGAQLSFVVWAGGVGGTRFSLRNTLQRMEEQEKEKFDETFSVK